MCLLVQEKKTPIFKFIFSSEEKTQGTDSVPSDDAAGGHRVCLHGIIFCAVAEGIKGYADTAFKWSCL